MNLDACQTIATATNSLFWYVVIMVIIFVSVIFCGYKMHTKAGLKPRWFSLLISAFCAGGALLACAFAITVFFALAFWHDDNPPSADYHNLNAAIKNTCYLDPLHRNCPHSVQDLINIQPQQFIPETAYAHLTYQYYPETNQYTLIVRNDDVSRNNDRVVIYDPRLATDKTGYGNGLDFVDAPVFLCNGKYYLRENPPFPGPWNQIN